VEAVIYTKLKDRLRKIVPNFATRISGLFADVEAPGNESGKH